MQACDFTIFTFQTILTMYFFLIKCVLLLSKCPFFLSCHPIPRSGDSIKYFLSTKPSFLLLYIFFDKQTSKPSAMLFLDKQTDKVRSSLFWLCLSVTEFDCLYSQQIIFSLLAITKTNSVDLLWLLTKNLTTGSSDHSL